MIGWLLGFGCVVLVCFGGDVLCLAITYGFGCCIGFVAVVCVFVGLAVCVYLLVCFCVGCRLF